MKTGKIKDGNVHRKDRDRAKREAERMVREEARDRIEDLPPGTIGNQPEPIASKDD
jgi:hypothetical protein